jgi:4-diphosphocytidyl-2-C-methyl-D-erythritol kinase
MGEDLPPERNIVTKAVSLFREKTGYAKPLRIKLEKRVPLGGGLGGGSSDGASALIALNALAEADLSREDLGVMAEKLGSDVPFFLIGGAALVEGRGERIRPLDGPREPLWVVLVNPGFPSETGAAFAKLDAFRERTAQSAGGFTGFKSSRAVIPDNVLTEEPSRWPRGNDFLPVLQEDGGNGEAYRRITGDLQILGAEFAGLSGAGSTCFGIFLEREKAEKAEAVLQKRWNFVRLTFFLARFIKPVLQYD